MKFISKGELQSLFNFIYKLDECLISFCICIFFVNFASHCPGGEIGRRASLRGWWPYGCESSNLFLGTLKKRFKFNLNRFLVYLGFILLRVLIDNQLDCPLAGRTELIVTGKHDTIRSTPVQTFRFVLSSFESTYLTTIFHVC